MDLYCIEHSRGEVAMREKYQIFLIFFYFGFSLSCIRIHISICVSRSRIH